MLRSANDNDLAFIGDKKRIQAQKFTSCRHRGFNGNVFFIKQNADTAFNAGKFADAQKLYSEAAKNLGEETLAGRAKIGMAMSAISAGDSAKGMEALEKVYKEGSVYSAQAGYLLGLAKVQNGKVDEAKNLFKEISSNNNNGVFALLANQELSNLN